MPDVSESLTPATGRGATWPEPDGVFADVFPSLAGAGLSPDEVCDCPGSQADDGTGWQADDRPGWQADDGTGWQDDDRPGWQADDGPTVLPVLDPEPDEALDRAAAASPLASRACALARWLGHGRALTPAKVLRPADAAAAVADLGLDRPVLPVVETVDPRPFGRAVGSKGTRARSAKHLPALHPVWSAAVAAGLIEVRGQKAVPGQALALWSEPVDSGADPGVDVTNVHRRLDSWARMLAGYLRAQFEMEEADELWFAGPRQLLLSMSAILLYTAGDDVLTPPTLAMGALMTAMEDDEPDPMLLLTLPERVARWVEILQVWATTGVVVPVGDTAGARIGDVIVGEPSAVDEVAEQMEPLIDEIRELLPDAAPLLGPVLEALQSGPVVTVTRFGRDQLGRVLRGQGVPVPVVGDLADTPPAEFLLALSGHHPEAAASEIRIWLDARGQDWSSALQELVASASGKDREAPVRRAALPIVIALVSQAAESMIEEWRQDPWLAVPVALGLTIAAKGPQPPPEHLLWMAVDTLSAGLDDDDTFADLVDITGVHELLAAPGGVAVAVGLDHPQAREVLRLLVDHLEDRKLAKQLRRSLVNDRSRRARKTLPSRPPLPGL